MSNPGKVLIVDDEPFARYTVEVLLKREGYNVVFATNGIEGLRMAQEISPDVILLDVMMPEMDGFEVCHRLKTDPKTAHIPVLLVTVLSERKERLKGIELGANDYLTKPIDSQDLRLRVRNAIQSKHLYDQLQRSYEQLQNLESLRDNLTHMIVHDMRSSITGIVGFLHLLKTSCIGKLNDKETSYLGKAHNSIERLIDMINSLLDVSRLEAGEMPINRTVCNLIDLIHSAVAPLESLVGKRRLIIDPPPSAVAASCDLDLIRRVIANLVGNALKFTPHDGEVRIAFSNQDNVPKITVKDTGPGIPQEHHQRIFQKFGQVGMGRQHLGSGLGLTFCKLAVEAHGGSIGVDSEDGKGSTFWFTLPVKQPVEKQVAA